MSAYLVSESRIIAAEPQQLFDIVANPAMHPVIDGSGTVQASSLRNARRLSLGARFGMDMRMGAPYKITSRVIEFDEGRVIAWRHPLGHLWRYLFEAVDGGTQVTEQWDARRSPIRVVHRMVGFPARNRRGIAATLERLDRVGSDEAYIGGQGTGGQSPLGSG